MGELTLVDGALSRVLFWWRRWHTLVRCKLDDSLAHIACRRVDQLELAQRTVNSLAHQLYRESSSRRSLGGKQREHRES